MEQRADQTRYSSRMRLFRARSIPLSRMISILSPVETAHRLQKQIATYALTLGSSKEEKEMYQFKTPMVTVKQAEPVHAAILAKAVMAWLVIGLLIMRHCLEMPTGKFQKGFTLPNYGRNEVRTLMSLLCLWVMLQVELSLPLRIRMTNYSICSLDFSSVSASLSRLAISGKILESTSNLTTAQKQWVWNILDKARMRLPMAGPSRLQLWRMRLNFSMTVNRSVTERMLFSQPSILAVKLAKISNIVGITTSELSRMLRRQMKLMKLEEQKAQVRSRAMAFQTYSISVSGFTNISWTYLKQHSTGSEPFYLGGASMARNRSSLASRCTVAFWPSFSPFLRTWRMALSTAAKTSPVQRLSMVKALSLIRKRSTLGVVQCPSSTSRLICSNSYGVRTMGCSGSCVSMSNLCRMLRIQASTYFLLRSRANFCLRIRLSDMFWLYESESNQSNPLSYAF